MATNAPIIIIQIGKLLGTLKARSTPVIIAEPSVMVGLPFIKNFWIIYSKNTADATAIRVTRTASNPK